MNKLINFWIAALVMLAVIGCALYWMNQRPPRPVPMTSLSSSESPSKSEREMNAAPPPPPGARAPEPSRPTEGRPMLAVTRITEPPPFTDFRATAKLKGSGETAVLSDESGTSFLKATPTNPIYSLKSSPSGQQVVVSRGDGINELYSLQPFRLICQLPLVPDIPRASAFGPWDWIDEFTLVAAVDVARPATELAHLTGAERESAANWREETLLYSFNLADGKLMRIDTAKAGLPPSFTVTEMRAGGLVKVEWDENGAARYAWIVARPK